MNSSLDCSKIKNVILFHTKIIMNLTLKWTNRPYEGGFSVNTGI